MPIAELNLDLRARIKRKDLQGKRRLLTHLMEGSWAALRKGQGMEFAGYREYTYGDDAGRIDWSASLRSKSTLVRELEEFKTFNVFFIVDVSESMLYSSTGQLKAEYAAELVFDMVLASNDADDAVGLGMASHHFVGLTPPDIGTTNIFTIMRDLENPQLYGGKLDISHVLRLASLYLPEQRTIIVLVSDFIGFGEGWERYVRMLEQRYDLLGIMVRDPADEELPRGGGQYRVQDPYTGQVLLIDASQYRKAYAEDVAHQERYIFELFRKNKSQLLKLRTDEEYFEPLSKFLRKQARLTGN